MVERIGPQISVSMLVMTADGHPLGRIKTTSNTCIQLDVMLGPDFWVGRELIRDTSAGLVVLRVPRDFFNQRPSRGHGTHTGIHADEGEHEALGRQR